MNLRENLWAAINQANPPGSMQTGHESVSCGLLRTILRHHPAEEDVTEELRLLRELRQALDRGDLMHVRLMEDQLDALGEVATKVPRQPPIGGFCDDCGHLAARHDVDGCEGMEHNCSCEVMQWDGYKWPRPYLPAPDGLRRE